MIFLVFGCTVFPFRTIRVAEQRPFLLHYQSRKLPQRSQHCGHDLPRRACHDRQNCSSATVAITSTAFVTATATTSATTPATAIATVIFTALATTSTTILATTFAATPATVLFTATAMAMTLATTFAANPTTILFTTMASDEPWLKRDDG
ncbi:hypothetical protein NMG60_11012630 [Bertholletia excelsa]